MSDEGKCSSQNLIMEVACHPDDRVGIDGGVIMLWPVLCFVLCCFVLFCVVLCCFVLFCLKKKKKD